MSLENKTSLQAIAEADIAAVGRQLTSLGKDMSRLTEAVRGIAERSSSRMSTDIAEGFDDARHYAQSKGRSAEAQFQGSVASHPLMTIGLAVGAGFLIGILWRR